jgi:hypothetical protein
MPGAAAFLAPGLLLFAGATAAESEIPAGLSGLLSPAQVPDGPPGCLRANTRERFAVFAVPDAASARLGWLRFHPWRDAGEDCEAVEARFEDGERTRLVPTQESGYEVPALPVLEARGDWLRIALGERTGWLRRPAGATYDPYPALLADKLAYATASWNGELCAAPNQSCRDAGRMPEQALRVVAVRGHEGEDWLEVELTSEPCRDAETALLARGWMRARGEGRPAVWFHSRGC